MRVMAIKLHGTLGDRIVQAYGAKGWTRAEFLRRLQKTLPKTNYAQVRKWELGAVPRKAQLDAICEVTGYGPDDLLHGVGIAHPSLLAPEHAQERARLLISRFLAAGAADLSPVTEDEVTFLEQCAITREDATAEDAEAWLLGFRAGRLQTAEAATALNAAIARRMRRLGLRLITTTPKPPKKR